MTFKEATDLLSVSLRQIAEAVDRNYPSVLAYRTGDRVPPPEVTRKLARFMRKQSAVLLRAADELDPPR